jgi:tight adherence protein B
VTEWETALVAAGCVFAMVRPVDGSMGRINRPLLGGSASYRFRRPAHRWRLAPIALLVGLVALRADRQLVVVVAAGLLMSFAARRLVGLSRQRRARRDRQRRVVMLCDALSAELSAGLPMTTAIRRCCEPDPDLAPVVMAAELGGEIAEAMRGCARLRGGEGLRAVAAAWDVAGSSGTALAGVLDRVAGALRDDEDARAEVLAALGPPRATARMLALLPVFGLALGVSIDAHPIGFLVGTSWGLGCLFGGAGLALAGVWWVERLAQSAEV